MKTCIFVFLIAFVLSLTAGKVLQVRAAETSRADSLEKAKKHFSFAIQYKNNGDYDDALKNYTLSLAYNDSVYQVHYSFADLLMKMNKTDHAKREFLAAYKLNPDHFKSAAMLSRIYYEAADYDSALIMYEAMYRLEPGQLSILSGIASLRDYLGMKQEALAAYEELIRKGEDSYENLMRATALAISLEKMKPAQDFANRALEKHPGDINALKAALLASLSLNDRQSAAVCLRRIALADSTGTQALIQLQDLYRSSGNTQGLIWALTEHHRRSPDDIETIGELAELLIREGKTDEGVACIREGLEISPGDGKLRILLGDYYQKQGEKEKALQEFRIALKDEAWRSSAQQFIWRLEKPETDSEKAEREFFNRGNSVHPR